MTPITLAKYLCGSREVTLAFASHRASFWIGLLLVFSAGLAREYDGEDLVHEPWHALRPAAASLASGTTLFLLVHLACLLRSKKGSGSPPGFPSSWLRFMGLFWLTAPMAWLYAVPYERMLEPVQAVQLNLWTLALVSLWRVLLITRAISILYGIKPGHAFFLVMLFADAVAFAVITTVPTPVIDVMGGIRQSERDALLSSVTLLVAAGSVLSAPLWAIGAAVSAATLRPAWPDRAVRPNTASPRGLLVFAIASVLAFTPLLIMSQPEQIKKRQAEAMLLSGQIAQALATMSRHEPDAYPPNWNPPPRLGYGETAPSLDEVRDAMSQQWPADWVAEPYLDKIDRRLRQELMPFWSYATWPDIAEQLSKDGAVRPITSRHRRTAAFLAEHTAGLSGADRQALTAISQLPSTEPAAD